MKRSLIILFSFVFIFTATVDGKKTTRAHRKGKISHAKTSATSAAYCPGVKTITDCQAEGCPKPGDAPFRFDPELNKRKNIPSDGKPAVKHDFAWLQSRSDPDRTKFTDNNKDRNILQGLGEGDMVTVVAYALAAKLEGQETCNCGLSDPKDTDVHIVLVDPSLQNPSLANDEKESETAEFTPRVRLDHPNFTQAKLEPLIDPTWKAPAKPKNGKLLVRVTGLLMFDSYHFLNKKLTRHNNWEIHPILKFEYCPSLDCKAESDANWKDLESD